MPSDAEVIVGDPAVPPGQFHDFGKEQVGHFVLQQPRLVLAGNGGVEDRRVQRQVHKPAEEQVGLQPRAQLPVRAHRVERLQHLALQQRLRRDRRCAVRRINLVEVLVHRAQRFVAQPLDRPDRVLGGDQRLDVDQTHETRLGRQLSAHAFTTHVPADSLRTFSAAC